MMGAFACTTCRMIRRFVLAFGLGGFLAWQVTGTLPFDGAGADTWKGLMMVAVLFSFFSVFLRMKQMRQRWRR